MTTREAMSAPGREIVRVEQVKAMIVGVVRAAQDRAGRVILDG
ncbi:hypothetical protein ACQEVB_32170 [Pseudonocardia sp. CA-107938]